jgi:5-(aminomethyl)-3-furanmethanol phosphate kinase
MADRDTTVIKLGGSHAFAQHLRPWLQAICRCAGYVVVVPGGGPFAEAVRVAQGKMGFDDGAAHHMALLAMEQYACALASIEHALIMADSLTGIRRALGRGQIPVWCPVQMVLRAKDIPASWEVTSDSLAAWLAGQLGARRMLLVKHLAAPIDCGLAGLVAHAVVDEALPRFLQGLDLDAYVAGPSDFASIVTAIREGSPVGIRVTAR